MKLMLEKLKKSRAGQAILLAFAVTSVSVAVVVWMYESIRIPTLSGQVQFRDDKLKSVEDDLQKQHEKTSQAEEDVKRERAEASKWKTSNDQAAVEISQLARKLQDSQNAHAKALEELSQARRLQTIQADVARTNS